MENYVKILDTTLRDGEQTQGVSFSPEEKFSIAKTLLEEAKVDLVEVGNARVSKGEQKAIKRIADWAAKKSQLEKVEVLGFVDFKESADWIKESGCKVMNLLAKGSKKHCEQQLGKSQQEHFEDVKKTVEYAQSNGLKVNVYLEDFSNGMKDSPQYVFEFVEQLQNLNVERIMLPDTLGILSPNETKEFCKLLLEKFKGINFDFHAHNDYGLALANSLAAVEAGVRCVHVTVNGLGERAGNASLDEVVTVLKDKTFFKTGVEEKALSKLSKMVETFSGKRVAANKPIVGENVFTQTAGIHADGDKKGNLYANKLLPERFGREREYALGKLSGKASLEMNLRKLGMELNEKQLKEVLKRVVELGDKKEKITPEDLPFIVADVLDEPQNKRIEIKSYVCTSAIGKKPRAELKIKAVGKEVKETAEGDGGYDAFMNALQKASKKLGFKIAELEDYEVRIPPGGNTDAIVEATISWKNNGNKFKTVGVDSDQLVAAIKATEKMLNLVAAGKNQSNL